MVEIVTRTGITAIVVSKGLEGLLRFCVDALDRSLKKVGGNHHIIVADNASNPPCQKSLMKPSGIELLRFDRPARFARANNAAAALQPSDFYLLLNNDVILAEEALACMLRLLVETPSAGICGSRLLFPDGSLQHCGVVFGPGDVGPYHVSRKKPAHQASRMNQEFQAVTGACLLVRKQVWDELGGLDESYPFGLEDIDFCLRARQRGWRVFCCGETDSLHFEASTPGRVALDIPSRKLFMERWNGHYTIDG